MANIHIKPEIVVETIVTHFPTKQKECIREYNVQLKASNGAGIAASKLWNVCAAGGLDIKKTTDSLREASQKLALQNACQSDFTSFGSRAENVT